MKPKFEEKVAKTAIKHQPTQLAGAVTVTPVSTPATAATTTCLTQEYLDTGAQGRLHAGMGDEFDHRQQQALGRRAQLPHKDNAGAMVVPSRSLTAECCPKVWS